MRWRNPTLFSSLKQTRQLTTAWLAKTGHDGCRTQVPLRVIPRASSSGVGVLLWLESLIAFARCTDDMPRNLAVASLENSWRAILKRVASQGVEPGDCEVFERETVCAEVARTFGATVEQTDALR